MAELIRGKTGRVYGNLFSLLTVMKGLPLAYNKRFPRRQRRHVRYHRNHCEKLADHDRNDPNDAKSTMSE